MRNEGLTGTLSEVDDFEVIDGGDDINHGVVELLFEKIGFHWSRDEIEIHDWMAQVQGQTVNLDIYLGPFNLEANDQVIVSPDTWGYTAVQSGLADAYEQGADAGFVLSNTDIWLKTDTDGNSSQYWRCGGGWWAMSVPQGATVSSAYWKGTCMYDGRALLSFYANDVDDADDYFETGDIIDRTRTTAYVAWDNSGQTDGTEYTSPDLKTVVQEVVSRGGWSSGNGFALLLIASDQEEAIVVKYAAWEHVSYDPMKLQVTYTSFAMEQEGFRWRNDDGDEDEATWRQNQDVDDTVAKSTNVRLRTLVDATGDPPTQQATLQYKRSDEAAAEWRDV
jgi:hypothetical protein